MTSDEKQVAKNLKSNPSASALAKQIFNLKSNEILQFKP